MGTFDSAETIDVKITDFLKSSYSKKYFQVHAQPTPTKHFL